MFRLKNVRLSFSAAYHLTCVVYILWLDYHMLWRAIHMFVHRQDLFMLYCHCLGLQFLTFHSTLMQLAFFGMVLRADIAEVMGDLQLCNKLRRWADFLFKYVGLPFTTIVCVNFWVLQEVLNWPLVESDFFKYYVPSFLNHGMHTLSFIMNVGELVITPRHFPLQTGIFRMILLILAYIVWIYTTHMLSGRWPYIFMEDMSKDFMQQFCYAIANLAIAILSYTAAGAFNNILWYEHKKNDCQKRK